MESKLKSLKVVDLKTILQQANVPIAGKANKADLIAKILASPEAIQHFNTHNGVSSSVRQQPASIPAVPPLAPEQRNAAPPSTTTVPPQVASVRHQSAPSDAQDIPDTPTTSVTLQSLPMVESAEIDSLPVMQPASSTNSAALNDELEKRKARSARFGTTYVDPKAESVTSSKSIRGKIAVADAPEKVASRHARFGTTPVATSTTQSGGRNKPGSISTVSVDAEEEERRRKRTARFGLGDPVDSEEENLRKRRTARFAA